jgi:hypothetical protein
MKRALAFLLLMTLGHTVTKSDDLPLPKGWYPLDEILSTSNGLLVATLESTTMLDPGPPGATYYSSLWRVTQVRRGNFPEKIECVFCLQTFPESQKQRLPTPGNPYLLVMYPNRTNQIAYIFDATKQKLAEIETMISQTYSNSCGQFQPASATKPSEP